MPYRPTGKKVGRPKKTPTETPTQGVIIDPDLVDPRAVLAEIAADREAPAGARVQAAKALMGSPPAGVVPAEGQPVSEVTRRALAIMQRTSRPN